MSRLASVCLSIWAATVAADVPSRFPALPDTSCLGQPEGAACGDAGRCTKVRVRRPDFSAGVPPRWTTTEVMVCEDSRTSAWRWAPALLLMAAMGALLLRRREPSRSPAGRASLPA